MSIIISEEFKTGTQGVFRIPPEIYHNHKIAQEVNRGLLVKMATETPAHVKAAIECSYTKKPTKQMIGGTLIDMALLEPDRFKEGLSHWISPEGLDLRTKDGIAWKKDHPDLPVIPAKSHNPNEASAEDINGMIASVMEHSLGRQIVDRSSKQESAFAIDPNTGILCKCRPDTRLEDDKQRLTLADLKSTFPGGASKEAFKKHCAAMGYYLQDTLYSNIYETITGERPFFIFVVVERKPPYAVQVFQITQPGKKAGKEQIARALERYAECKASNKWPCYPEVIVPIDLPQWKIAAIEQTK